MNILITGGMDLLVVIYQKNYFDLRTAKVVVVDDLITYNKKFK